MSAGLALKAVRQIITDLPDLMAEQVEFRVLHHGVWVEIRSYPDVERAYSAGGSDGPLGCKSQQADQRPPAPSPANVPPSAAAPVPADEAAPSPAGATPSPAVASPTANSTAAGDGNAGGVGAAGGEPGREEGTSQAGSAASETPESRASSCRSEFAPPAHASSQKKTIKSSVLAALALGAATAPEIAQRLDVRRHNVQQCLSDLKAMGAVVHKRGVSGTPGLYSLPALVSGRTNQSDSFHSSAVQASVLEGRGSSTLEPSALPSSAALVCLPGAAIGLSKNGGQWLCVGPTSARPFEVSRAAGLALKRLQGGILLGTEPLANTMGLPRTKAVETLRGLSIILARHGAKLVESPVGWRLVRA